MENVNAKLDCMGCQGSYLLLELFDGRIVGQVIRTQDRELFITLLLDFTLQFGVLSLQHSHLFKVASKAAIQDLHGLLLLTVDALTAPATVIHKGAGAEVVPQAGGPGAKAGGRLAAPGQESSQNRASWLAAAGFKITMLAAGVRRSDPQIGNPRAALAWC